MEVDHKEFPWTLWSRYVDDGAKEYVPEESFTTLELAQKARDEYKKETPTDMFIIRPTIEG